MSFQPQFPGIFDVTAATPIDRDISEATEATPLPATEKQMHYAQVLSLRTGAKLPAGILQDRFALSKWIDAQKAASTGKFANYPSSKQVAFAERIARLKRRDIPRECFQDRTMMSRWIDGNKPR